MNQPPFFVSRAKLLFQQGHSTCHRGRWSLQTVDVYSTRKSVCTEIDVGNASWHHSIN